MAYVELHQAVFDHRKTIVAAERLNMPEVHLVGHLVALWSWCLDNCQDGILPDSVRVVARGARWDGDPSAFLEALVLAGFVDVTDRGKVIHDWSEYGGKLIAKRRANAEKQSRYRERQGEASSPQTNVTVTLPSRNALEKRREEKTREEQNGESPPEGPPLAAEPEPSDGTIRQRRPDLKPRPMRLPPDWSPTTEAVTWAVDATGMSPSDVAAETEKFRDHFQANGKAMTDWPAAWRNWMRRATEFRPPPNGTRPNGRASPHLPKVMERDSVPSDGGVGAYIASRQGAKS